MPADILQFPLFSGESELEQAGDLNKALDCGNEKTLNAAGRNATAKRAESPTQSADTSLSDEHARMAALDIHRSWIVEAPAGSGKTGLLIQRLLKLLAESDITSPSEILAITFTRKAAQELRNRVLEQLTAAAHETRLTANASPFDQATRSLAQAVQLRDRALGWHLLDHPQQLNIRTIDSFCGELARGMPVLAGGIGQRRPLEDASSLYKEAAERVLRELGGTDKVLDKALRCLLLHRDARVGDCIALIAGMLAAREQWGELVPLAASELTEQRLDGPVRHQLEQTLELVIREGLTRAQATLPHGWLDDLASLACRLSSAPGYKGYSSPLSTCAGRPNAPAAVAADLERWLALVNLVLTNDGTLRSSLNNHLLGFELPKELKPELKDLITRLGLANDLGTAAVDTLCSLRDLPAPILSDEQWTILKAVFHVLRRALVELELLFSSGGVCDFTALSLAARQLFHPELNAPNEFRVPGLQLQHLLVDEMQDTSIGQYRLFDSLTRSWDGFSQTVFLVGDPKQSIYAFRQARVERFLRTQKTGQLGEVPLGTLQLTANFRSQAELVNEFNRIFASIFPPSEELTATSATQSVEVPFTAAVAVRSSSVAPAVHWHAGINFAEKPAHRSLTTAESAAETYAHAIRTEIEAFLSRWPALAGRDQPSRTPRIAVLARNRAHLGPVITELKRDYGNGPVPFRAVEIELLNERPEVLDLLALTRALLHPGDRIAWLAVLRSPVCGLGLADLLALTSEGPDAEITATVGCLVQKRHGFLSLEGQQLLGRIWPILQSALQTLGTNSLATHVERTWRSLGADAFLDPDSLVNARRFLLLLHDLESEASLSLPHLERRLHKLYAEATDANAVVELMTIHKSKGLEWDLVLIPALERGSGRADGELLRWFEMDAPSVDGSPIVLAPVSAKGGEGSRLWRWLGKLKTERELAESKRLFYVACTRAREEIHLFGSVKLARSGAIEPPKAASLLRAAWPAALPVFQAALTTARTNKTESTHSDGETRPIHESRLSGPPLRETFPPLAIAAATEDLPSSPAPQPPSIARLPASFDPLARWQVNSGPRLPYPAANSLRNAAPFSRPEGSFAARAFGNVLHRFFDLASRKLEAGHSPEALTAELPQWSRRVHQSFRAEGLPPPLCDRETARAVRALQATLLDATGLWVLAPHVTSWTERTLQLSASSPRTAPSTLRADRLFLGGSEPLSLGDTHLWVVDFKTSEQGGHAEATFLAAERRKYTDQLETYARACLAAEGVVRPVILALFYPLIPQMVYWPFSPKTASQLEAEPLPGTLI